MRTKQEYQEALAVLRYYAFSNQLCEYMMKFDTDVIPPEKQIEITKDINSHYRVIKELVDNLPEEVKK